jgi:hypothetical protein
MSHDHIKFLPVGRIEVWKDAVSFGSEQQLNARIFQLQDCDMKEDKEGNMILYDHDREVGEIWFDGHAQAQIGDCVILGRDEKRWEQQDYQGYLYILLVSATHGKRYSRHGVGKVKSQYMSRTSVEGILV